LSGRILILLNLTVGSEDNKAIICEYIERICIFERNLVRNVRELEFRTGTTIELFRHNCPFFSFPSY